LTFNSVYSDSNMLVKVNYLYRLHFSMLSVMGEFNFIVFCYRMCGKNIMK